MFSDRIRTILSGIICSVSEEESHYGTIAIKTRGYKSRAYLKHIDKDGMIPLPPEEYQ